MKRMLVDATHPEETRVAVVSGNRLEELDFEIASRKQLKGNIYLAKVTRVEPSLQAAFVEYGGNRHGFLAFSEVHPDYYRIPVADREALIAEERRQEEEAEARAERAERQGRRSFAEEIQPEEFSERISPMPSPIESDDENGNGENGGNGNGNGATADADGDAGRAEYAGDDGGYAEAAVQAYADPGAEPEAYPAGDVAVAEAGRTEEPAAADDDADDRAADEQGADEQNSEDRNAESRHADDHGASAEARSAQSAENFDVVGGDDVEEVHRRRTRPLRSYKIQEVIKRRQIMLVQVTKEERGNKGAALTTYLSLPGRYCVLMPNTGRGGGISRKITNPADRKRLKEILSELDIPDGMAVILRTAGLERSKQEIKRDLEYLLRLWDDIREQTLKSSAPCLIYEEANLIKRAIRDLYGNDIDEIWVEGDAGYRAARDFMRMLMPSHVKRVQSYKDEAIPLFHRYQVETQIDAIHSPVVHLRSGGYIVINPTEALVAIDVNSGKSTRERNIEETAFKTNLEAAEEVARQLRLRDLAGLIVIDFIDMEEPRNNATVERRLKEAMKTDRARIQLGRISGFGLLELSRQRLRPSLLETNFERCPHCSGTGVVRSVESASLHVLRAIEEEGIRKRSAEITVTVPTAIALYILNQKRTDLARIEYKYGFRVLLQADDTLIAPDLRLERVKAKQPGDEGGPLVSAERIFAETDRTLAAAAAAPAPVPAEVAEPEEVDEDEDEGTEAEASEEGRADAGEGGEAGDRRRRRRRRRRGRNGEGRDESRPAAMPAEAGAEEGVSEATEAGEDGDEGEEDDESADRNAADGDQQGRKKRRRGKRGGRRRSRRELMPGETAEGSEEGAEDGEGTDDGDSDGETGGETEGEAPARAPVVPPAPVAGPALEPIDFDWILDTPPPAAEPAPAAEAPAEVVAETPAPEAAPAAEEAKPKKRPSRSRKKAAEPAAEEAPAEVVAETPAPAQTEAPEAEEAKPKKRPSRSRKKAEPAAEEAPVEAVAEAPAPAEVPAAEEAKPKKRPARPRKKAAEPAEAPAETLSEPATVAVAELAAPEAVPATEEQAAEPAPEGEENQPARTAEVVNQPPEKPKRGWWNR